MNCFENNYTMNNTFELSEDCFNPVGTQDKAISVYGFRTTISRLTPQEKRKLIDLMLNQLQSDHQHIQTFQTELNGCEYLRKVSEYEEVVATIRSVSKLRFNANTNKDNLLSILDRSIKIQQSIFDDFTEMLQKTCTISEPKKSENIRYLKPSKSPNDSNPRQQVNTTQKTVHSIVLGQYIDLNEEHPTNSRNPLQCINTFRKKPTSECDSEAKNWGMEVLTVKENEIISVDHLANGERFVVTLKNERFTLAKCAKERNTVHCMPEQMTLNIKKNPSNHSESDQIDHYRTSNSSATVRVAERDVIQIEVGNLTYIVRNIIFRPSIPPLENNDYRARLLSAYQLYPIMISLSFRRLLHRCCSGTARSR